MKEMQRKEQKEPMARPDDGPDQSKAVGWPWTMLRKEQERGLGNVGRKRGDIYNMA